VRENCRRGNIIKKSTLLLILLVSGALVTEIAVIQELSFCASRSMISIEEIISNPDAWVNRTVLLEGSLFGPMMHIPEYALPWNYGLVSTKPAFTRSVRSIGVLWNSETSYNGRHVVLLGTVRKDDFYSYGHYSFGYYVEAGLVFS